MVIINKNVFSKQKTKTKKTKKFSSRLTNLYSPPMTAGSTAQDEERWKKEQEAEKGEQVGESK